MAAWLSIRAIVCVAVISVACTHVAGGACKIALVGELRVDTTHNRVITEGEINGQSVKVLIDTGSQFTFVWEDAARRLNLPIQEMQGVRIYGVGGRSKSSRALVKHLQAGKFYADDLNVVVLDRGAVHDSASTALVLGDDLFSHFDTEFDLAHGRIRLLRTEGCEPGQTPYWAKEYSMGELEGWDVLQPQIRMRVLVNGKPISAVFDTGAPTSIITRNAAEVAGVTPWLEAGKPDTKIGGTGSKMEDSWIGTFASFSVGDESVKNVALRISDMFKADREVQTGSHIAAAPVGLPTMLVGCDFFLAHHMLVLSTMKKMVFTYDGGPIFQATQTNRPVHTDAEPAVTPQTPAADANGHL